jgi:hypothetical protein
MIPAHVEVSRNLNTATVGKRKEALLLERLFAGCGVPGVYVFLNSETSSCMEFFASP